MGTEFRGAEARDVFIGWQCRVRQHAMRHDQGRPSPGMMPRVLDLEGRILMDRMVVLIVPIHPGESTAFFRHQVRRSHDRREVMEKGLAFLQATHFQVSTGFRDEVTALFGPESAMAGTLTEAGTCVLEFTQFSQAFRLPCRTRALKDGSGLYQATLWHNRLFNPQLPDGVIILGFQPDWDLAEVTEGA